MIDSYIKLTIAALLPVVASLIIYFLDKKTKLGKVNKVTKQVLIGIVFGCLAIVGTEWGIPISGAQVNCRDAAVLVAGLLFGGPAGIIAGLIGGIERWVAVAWGVGSFTRVACSVSTVIAGFYAAAMRKFMFENKKPGWLLSLAIGVVMEVFHLTMVFVTNMSTPAEAMRVVMACSLPMIIANGVSVMLSAMVISLLAKEFRNKIKHNARISQTIQRWLLVTVVFAFAFSTAFLFQLQTGIANRQVDAYLTEGIEDVSLDIQDASDENLLELTILVSNELQNSSIKQIADKYDIAEINIINDNGIIVESTNSSFLGYNMNTEGQSNEFMLGIKDNGEYVQSYGPISYNQKMSRKYAGVKINNGYLQVGYDAEDFQKDIANQVDGITKNRHVGQSGYVIIIDKNANVVSAPSDFHLTKIDNSTTIADIKEGENFKVNINGVNSYCRYKSTEGFYIVSVLPVDEAVQLRNMVMVVNTYMEILIFAILFIFIYLIIKKVVVNKIKEINSSLAKITNGDLNEVIDVRSNEEFESLSDDINSTVDTLKHYIDEASARIDKELEFAKNIQSSALPTIFPAFPLRTEFDIYATMTPAKSVGGDFYDFYFVGENTMAFLIADVSGKGIPAAMFMMTAKTLIKNLAETGIPVEEVFTRANNELCKMNDAGMFVTAWLGEININTGVLSFVNAGHNPPLVKHGSGDYEYLKARSGLVLAGMEGINYRRNEIQLMPGDKVYLYTDGVTEATNAQTKLYSDERLLKTINSIDVSSCKAVCENVFDSVNEFVDGAEQFDDITMLAFELKEINGYNELTVIPTVSSIPRVTEFVETWLLKTKVDKKIVNKVNIAIDEIYSNIANYSGANWAKVFYTRDVNSITLIFTDNGIEYNPLENEDPDVTLSAEDRQIGGLGVFMVKKIMDNIEYSYEDGMNILKLTKNI